jgi:hypothetical protein
VKVRAGIDLAQRGRDAIEVLPPCGRWQKPQSDAVASVVRVKPPPVVRLCLVFAIVAKAEVAKMTKVNATTIIITFFMMFPSF